MTSSMNGGLIFFRYTCMRVSAEMYGDAQQACQSAHCHGSKTMRSIGATPDASRPFWASGILSLKAKLTYPVMLSRSVRSSPMLDDDDRDESEVPDEDRRFYLLDR